MIKRVFDRVVCKCNKCNYVWIPSGDIPYHCAKCKSARWNDKRLLDISIAKPVKPKVIPIKKPEVVAEKIELKPEEYSQAFKCAMDKKFNCDTYKAIHSDDTERVVIPYDYCKACADSEFWQNADSIREFYFNEINTETNEVINTKQIKTEKQIEIKKYESEKEKFERLARNCEKRVTLSGISNCTYFNEKMVLKPECRLCWELEDIWGHLAIKAKAPQPI